MKKASSLTVNSPKTPGGISKSLLTPCRRVGLSRNWRKGSVSPFISPLSGSPQVSEEIRESRKRKGHSEVEVCDSKTETIEKEQTEDDSQICEKNVVKGTLKSEEIHETPTRNVVVPKRKKSKTVTSPKAVVPPDGLVNSIIENNPSEVMTEKNTLKTIENSENIVTTPMRVKSKSKLKKLSVSVKDSPKTTIEVKENFDAKVNTGCPQNTKDKSPNNLSKECFVVIRNKIFKKDIEKKNKVASVVSQALFDSDSDDVPLSVLNKDEKQVHVENKVEKHEMVNLDDEDDFETTKVHVKKLEDKTTSTSSLKPNVRKKVKEKVANTKATQILSVIPTDSKTSSQSSIDDDDDFIIDKKRTILIKKTYEKVKKPQKAKSTGSITQRDIDELKARIEMKKTLLLAKAMGHDTEELRTLIKKWQRGCQDALVELMDLMKMKLQDKKNMVYSEILQTLNIPPQLVGYDEENDCFTTPTDENIILSKFNNL